MWNGTRKPSYQNGNHGSHDRTKSTKENKRIWKNNKVLNWLEKKKKSLKIERERNISIFLENKHIKQNKKEISIKMLTVIEVNSIFFFFQNISVKYLTVKCEMTKSERFHIWLLGERWSKGKGPLKVVFCWFFFFNFNYRSRSEGGREEKMYLFFFITKWKSVFLKEEKIKKTKKMIMLFFFFVSKQNWLTVVNIFVLRCIPHIHVHTSLYICGYIHT